MNRRDVLRGLALAGLPGMLTACGGGGGGDGSTGGVRIDRFSSDRQQYFVGETAEVTAVFSGGDGRIDPGSIPVISGVPTRIASLSKTTELQLTVTSPSGTVRRKLSLNVAYRNTLQVIPTSFARAMHTTVEASDGHLFIIGGDGTESTSPSGVLTFNPYTESFAIVGDLLTGRVEHTATMLADGSILVFGGARGLDAAPVAERFNPRTGVSVRTASQPLRNRTAHAAVRLWDGHVLLIGGWGIDGATIDAFDPQTEQFERLAGRLQFERYGHTATLVSQHEILIIGGFGLTGTIAPPELFNIISQTSTVLPLPPSEANIRSMSATIPLPGGDVLIMGGENYLNGTPIDTVLRFSLPTRTVAAAGPMRTPRARFAATALLDGRVLVTGGTTEQYARSIASTELYLPDTGATSPGPAMSVGRRFHTADLLVTGKVLILGGYGDGPAVRASAELFG